MGYDPVDGTEVEWPVGGLLLHHVVPLYLVMIAAMLPLSALKVRAPFPTPVLAKGLALALLGCTLLLGAS